MAKNGHSKFFLTIFPKKTGINLEWPKMAVLIFSDNFSQKDWHQFGMAKKWAFQIYLNLFSAKRLEELSAKIWNGHFWLFQIYTSHFGKNCQKKFGMTKKIWNGHFWPFQVFF